MDMTESTSEPPNPALEERYDALLDSIRARFAAMTVQATAEASDATRADRALFTTDVVDLYSLFLGALPEELRQENECGRCRRFMERYGGLVVVDPRGRTTPLLWDPQTAPEPYRAAIAAVSEAVQGAAVTGVFLTSRTSWGTAEEGGWTHFAVTPDPALLCRAGPHRPAQLAADKREDYRSLSSAALEFPLPLVKRAAALLKTEQLYRSERCVGVAAWLLEVHQSRKSAKTRRARDNVTWLAVASAPPGFCHVRSSMIGSLLTDLKKELPFDVIAARFEEKMDPRQYQRPSAAPREQNIDRAERLVAQLRSAGALERRFARLDEVTAIWRPAQALERPAGGVFGHLKARPRGSAIEVDAPPVVITWTKFARVVLPTAASIDYRVEDRLGPYMALITAAKLDAPPIVQWDREERRNPFTWYFHDRASTPTMWCLKKNTRAPVTAICLTPHMWHPGESSKVHQHHAAMVFFLLEGARDRKYKKGSGFYPELLKSAYRGVRATLEAYAKGAVVAGAAEADACGIGLHANWWGYTFEVTDRDGVTVAYTIDRWD